VNGSIEFHLFRVMAPFLQTVPSDLSGAPLSRFLVWRMRIAHRDLGSLASDVLLYDRIVLPVPERRHPVKGLQPAGELVS
jgi:hypothetical protein